MMGFFSLFQAAFIRGMASLLDIDGTMHPKPDDLELGDLETDAEAIADDWRKVLPVYYGGYDEVLPTERRTGTTYQSITPCLHCGKVHTALRFDPYTDAEKPELTHAGHCPETNKRIYLKVKSDARASDLR
jgi:hypothetical protein